MWLTIILIILLTVCAVLKLRKPKGFPPGPPALPFVGSLPFLNTKKLFHMMLMDLKSAFGPVVGYYLMKMPTIAVMDRDIMVEALSKDEMQYRPATFFVKMKTFGKRLGVFFTDGPQWLEQRNFTLRHLREFGFGKHSMEGLIQDEAMLLLDDIKQASVESGRVDPTQLFSVSSVNLLWSIMAGVRYKHDDVNLHRVLTIVRERLRAGNATGGIVGLFPFIRKIAPKWSGYEAEMEAISEVNSFLMGNITEHMSSYNPNEMRDFIDVYLKEMKKHDGKETTFTDEQLTIICSDLFNAGADSVSTTLAFAILHMVVYPEAQQKVQKELDDVVGKDTLPSLKDRARLNYTEAVLAECLRMSNVAPIFVPHRPVKDVQIREYVFPKDSLVFFNVYAVHHDKAHWGDPDVFRPERFLNAEGKFVKDDHLMPFGYGKRRCLGEPLASAACFLFFTSVIQAFSFKVPDGYPKPSLVPLPGFTIAPKPFVAQVHARK